MMMMFVELLMKSHSTLKLYYSDLITQHTPASSEQRNPASIQPFPDLILPSNSTFTFEALTASTDTLGASLRASSNGSISHDDIDINIHIRASIKDLKKSKEDMRASTEWNAIRAIEKLHFLGTQVVYASSLDVRSML